MKLHWQDILVMLIYFGGLVAMAIFERTRAFVQERKRNKYPGIESSWWQQQQKNLDIK